MLKSIVILIINTFSEGLKMKIYDFKGKKNISGERIKIARTKRKITQADLAARLQVNEIIIERDSISRIEIGTRFVTDYEIAAISEILNVNPLWLLGLIDSED